MNTRALKTHGEDARRPDRLARLACLTLCLATLSGCAAVVVGGAAVVATDRRTTGTVLDDQTLEIKVVDRIHSAPEIDEKDHIKVEVYESVALLLGEVQSESNRRLAGARASEVEFIDRVVNELVIGESATAGQRLDNTWLTTKVNTALVKGNPVHGFDASRVSRAEGDAAAEVARNVRGVEKVVKVFNYTD
jgi:osmotically-inducible protein OsmY